MCFRFLQVTWRFLRTGTVPNQGHGIDYEAPLQVPPLRMPHQAASPFGETAR
jgi:hypothetical protein